MKSLFSPAWIALFLFGSVDLAWCDVLRVSASGGVEYLDIQAAVDAASDGDVIVVGHGHYPGFTVDGKGVTIVSMANHAPIVTGTVLVRDVPPASQVVLSALSLYGEYTYPSNQTPPPVLRIQNASGGVHLQDSTVQYTRQYDDCSYHDGVTAVEVIDSTRVSILASQLLGSNGTGSATNYRCTGRPGGHGLVLSAGSQVAIHDSVVEGGLGGDGGITGGHGGSGAIVEASLLFLSGSHIAGKRGGNAWDIFGFFPGDGGHGVTSDSGSEVVRLGSTFQAGVGGWAVSGTSSDGSPLHGDGVQTDLPGLPRGISAPRLAVAEEPFPLIFNGQAGDAVHTATGTLSGLQLWLPARGVWLLPFPAKLPVAPTTQLPSQSTVHWQTELPAAGAATLLLQSLHIETGGEAILGPMRAVVVLSPVPSNPDLDCNSTGVVDLVEILQGSSTDIDFNLLADDCTFQSPTGDWYVDAAAGPGGNGTRAAPFSHLAMAFTWAQDGDVVHLQPGLYLGAGNRELDLAGRAISLRGVGGAEATILDAEEQGRFIRSTTAFAGTIELTGLTFRNGRASSNLARGTDGGALLLALGPERLFVKDCRFEGNVATGTGGALRMTAGKLEIMGSLFTGGHASGGGAVSVSSLQHLWVQGSRFIENAATTGGGAAVRAVDTAGVLLQDCVIAGNTAHRGVLWIESTGCELPQLDTRLVGCTIVGNRLPQSINGHAFARLIGSVHLSVRNSILFGQPHGGSNSVHLGAAPGCALHPSIAFHASNVEAGPGTVQVGAGSILWGALNIDADPLFEDPAGPDGDPDTWLDNDLSLSIVSPCIDAGNNASVPPDVFDLDGDGDTTEPAPYDILGNPRIVDIPSVPDTGAGGPPVVDMGAYERQQ